jgi:hypothetical protein
VLCTTCRNHLYNLELLIMGIIVPETCWAGNKFAIKLFCCIQLVFIPHLCVTFSHLEAFILGVAIALHDIACPTLGCPIHVGSNTSSCNLFTGQSALPQPSGQHRSSTGGIRNIFFQHTLNVGDSAVMWAARARDIATCLFPSCSRIAFLRWIRGMLKLKFFHHPQTFSQYNRSPSIEKYFAMSDCPFPQNDTFTPFSRRFHCHDKSSWVLGRSSYQIMSFNLAWVMKCVSILLAPVSSEVSSDSGSESTVDLLVLFALEHTF